MTAPHQPTSRQIAEMTRRQSMKRAENDAAIEVESIGSDTYIYIARGHHDIHAFMRAVLKEHGRTDDLRVPTHIWMKTMPARNANQTCWYEPVPEGTRGAWPCTYTTEAAASNAYRPSPAAPLVGAGGTEQIQGEPS